MQGGSVVFTGPATWILTSAQAYTGGTTITGGTLQMGVVNAITGPVSVNTPGVLSLSNNSLAIQSLAGTGSVLLGSGNLTLNTTTTTTFSGVIQGTGAVTVQGTGVQIFTGANNYSGGTTIGANATLEGTTTGLQGAISNAGTLFFNQSASGQYAGPLTAAGLLQVGGGGVVMLTGTPTQGSVSVIGGELAIAMGANLTAPSVAVGSGGELGGGGTITGSVMNQGIINPEPLLTVTGNMTFQPGSSFVADLTPTSVDKLVVGGIATIQNGAQVIVDAEPGEYQAETRLPIITAAGGPVVGEFSSFVLTNPFLNVSFFLQPNFAGICRD